MPFFVYLWCPLRFDRFDKPVRKLAYCGIRGGAIVTTFQRALQLWSVLVFAAREQKVVSYEMLGRMTGMANEMGRELGHIYYYCKQKDLPLLNLLAVSKETGIPGDGCPEDLSSLPAQQARVFVYDWLGYGAPKVEDFEETRKTVEKGKAAATV